jgi:hypothetical protein
VPPIHSRRGYSYHRCTAATAGAPTSGPAAGLLEGPPVPPINSRQGYSYHRCTAATAGAPTSGPAAGLLVLLPGFLSPVSHPVTTRAIAPWLHVPVSAPRLSVSCGRPQATCSLCQLPGCLWLATCPLAICSLSAPGLSFVCVCSLAICLLCVCYLAGCPSVWLRRLLHEGMPRAILLRGAKLWALWSFLAGMAVRLLVPAGTVSVRLMFVCLLTVMLTCVLFCQLHFCSMCCMA